MEVTLVIPVGNAIARQCAPKRYGGMDTITGVSGERSVRAGSTAGLAEKVGIPSSDTSSKVRSSRVKSETGPSAVKHSKQSDAELLRITGSTLSSLSA